MPNTLFAQQAYSSTDPSPNRVLLSQVARASGHCLTSSGMASIQDRSGTGPSESETWKNGNLVSRKTTFNTDMCHVSQVVGFSWFFLVFFVGEVLFFYRVPLLVLLLVLPDPIVELLLGAAAGVDGGREEGQKGHKGGDFETVHVVDFPKAKRELNVEEENTVLFVTVGHLSRRWYRGVATEEFWVKK